MNIISSIIKYVEGDKRRTMLDSGGLSLGEEGNEGNKGGNGKLHVAMILVVEVLDFLFEERSPKSNQTLYHPPK